MICGAWDEPLGIPPDVLVRERSAPYCAGEASADVDPLTIRTGRHQLASGPVPGFVRCGFDTYATLFHKSTIGIARAEPKD